MYNTIIIGAGPSGLMASTVLNDCLILEKNDSAGKKLLLTGNGRCNITNKKSNSDFLNNISHNKKYLYSTINTFGPKEIYDFFVSNKVYLKEELDNKVFPVSDRAEDILNCLLNNSKAKINYNEEVEEIIKNDKITVITNKNKYECNNLIIASGGVSFPFTGSNGSHLKFAKMIEQPVTKLCAAESSLITNDHFIAGTTAFVNIKYNKLKSSGMMIFTHKGISGEVVMNISEHILDNSAILIDFIPTMSVEELIQMINIADGSMEINTFFKRYLQKRLVGYILNEYKGCTIKSLSSKTIIKIINLFKNHEMFILRKEAIEKAYVTKGGIDLNYINTKTFESKKNKNIYFIGEALDIHGPIGGYNLTLALSTGYSAGVSI